MRFLIDFSIRDDVRRFVRVVLSETRSELFQGVLVGYHPLWRAIADRGFDVGSHLVPFTRALTAEELPFQGIELEDPSQTAWWRAASKTYLGHEGADPFVVIFRLRPVGIDQIPEYQKIVRTIDGTKGSLFAHIEQRPLAKLFAGTTGSKPLEGGLRIKASSGSIGTVGGFLKDVASGNQFGVTCGHVAQVGDTIEYLNNSTNSWSPLGVCVESSNLPGSKACNVNCYLNAGAVDVDAALILLNKNVNAASIVMHISSKISERTDPTSIPRSVESVGAVSGHLALNANKFGIWQEFQLLSGDCICFKELFELNAISSSILSPKVALLFSKMVKNGDSGAWIVAPTSNGGYGYCGNVIGGDGISGFATFSKNVHGWAADGQKVTKARVLDFI